MIGGWIPWADHMQAVAAVQLFAEALAHLLLTVDDSEFAADGTA